MLRYPVRGGRGGGIRTPTRGFGDRWSAVKPTPLHVGSLFQCIALFGFAVRLMLAAIRAEFLQLDPLGCGFLFLCLRIIAILALSALKSNDFSWHLARDKEQENHYRADRV